MSTSAKIHLEFHTCTHRDKYTDYKYNHPQQSSEE